jgi:WD40 repeat protein
MLLKNIAVLFLVLASTKLLAIDFITPQAGETIIAGTTYKLTWEAKPGSSYSIFYSENGGENYTPIAENVTTNEYDWQVPELNELNIKLLCVANYFEEPQLLYSEDLQSGRVNSISYSEDGKQILITTFDNNIYVYSPTFSRVQVFPFPTLETIFDADFIGLGTIIFSAGGRIYSFQLMDGIPHEIAAGNFDINENIEKLEYGTSRLEIAAASYDGSFKVIDYLTGVAKKSFNSVDGHEFYSLKYSIDEKYIAAGDKAGRVYIYDFDNDLLSTIEPKVNPNITWNIARAIDFSSDNSEIVVAYADGSFSVYDRSSHAEIRSIDAHTSQIRAIEYHPIDQHIFAASMDMTFSQWESTKSLHVPSYTGQSNIDADYSQTGDTIAISTYQGSIQFWKNFVSDIDTAETEFNLKYKLKIYYDDYTVGYDTKLSITPKIEYNHQNQIPLQGIDAAKIYVRMPSRMLYPLSKITIERMGERFAFTETIGKAAKDENVFLALYNPSTYIDTLFVDSVSYSGANLEIELLNGSIITQDNCLLHPTKMYYAGETELKIYPNPADNFIKISCKLPENTLHEYFVYDIDGSQLPAMNGEIEHDAKDKEINISKLSSGLYTFEIVSESGKKYYARFFIIK